VVWFAEVNSRGMFAALLYSTVYLGGVCGLFVVEHFINLCNGTRE